MTDAVFNVRDVTYRYNDVMALSGLTLSVKAGQRIALLGANGSGKSTLLRLLDGLYFPERGNISAFGEPLIEGRFHDEKFAFGFRRREEARGRISKAGNSRARALLVEAAWALLRWRTPKTEKLHEWATRIAARRGKATAVVALARKMAGILFAIWRDGTEFNPEHLTGRNSTGAVAGG